MLKNYILVSFIFKILFYSRFAHGEEESEAEIRKKVLQDYNPSLPPVLFAQNPEVIFMNLHLFRIAGLDEKKGEFSVEGSLTVAWIDTRFSWESNTTQAFSVEHQSIWMPSLYIYNGIEPEEITADPLPVVVQGAALWEPRYSFKTSCNFNLRYYPFDMQVCDIIIASRSKEADFVSSKIPSHRFYLGANLHTYFTIENPQWSQDHSKIFQREMKIDSESYRKVAVYRFFVQRSMPLIPLGILTPCMSCTLLLLTTFWMEAGSTLRTGLCVTSMLVSSSSLFTLGKVLPASGSSTPIIVEYVSITLMFSAVSSIQATISSIFRRCQKLPPVSYSRIISSIPKWCLFLMGIAPENLVSRQLDQKFLFSELDDIENRDTTEKEENNANADQISPEDSLQSMWLKYISLFDRVMFYLLGLIILLFVISVIITE